AAGGRGSTARHSEPHAGLSARGGKARIGAARDRTDFGAQPSERRSHTVARRYCHDAAGEGGGGAAFDRTARPYRGGKRAVAELTQGGPTLGEAPAQEQVDFAFTHPTCSGYWFFACLRSPVLPPPIITL